VLHGVSRERLTLCTRDGGPDELRVPQIMRQLRQEICINKIKKNRYLMAPFSVHPATADQFQLAISLLSLAGLSNRRSWCLLCT
jgi:hypothetical protein